jgi:hypothetical protein
MTAASSAGWPENIGGSAQGSGMMGGVSLLQALLHAAPSQVTIDQIRRLIELVGPEAPMVEYKSNMTSTIAKAVAALANTHGGLVLVGVTDDRKITGVKEKTIEAVSQHCHSTLEPPWVPETLPIPLDDGSGKYVLILRVVPGIAPRPLLIDGAAPIRHNNTTHPATREQLAALFAEDDTLAGADPWIIERPRLEDHDHQVDLVIRSGLNIDIDPRVTWRPLREQPVDQLADALNRTSLTDTLISLVTTRHGCSIHKFHRRGLNRSRQINLEWRAIPDSWPENSPPPVKAQLSAQVPGGYGQTGTHLLVHLDALLNMGVSYHPRGKEPPTQPIRWWLGVDDFGQLMEEVIKALLDKHVVNAFGELAQIHPLAVPQPRVLHIISRQPMVHLLSTGLERIPEAGISYGAHLLADPGLDLADPESRREQVNAWLVETAMDAGLTGMEKLLAAREERSSQRPRCPVDP